MREHVSTWIKSSNGGIFASLFHVSIDSAAVLGSSADSSVDNNVISKNDTTPIVVVVPGLTSDSSAAVSCKTETYRSILLKSSATDEWNLSEFLKAHYYLSFYLYYWVTFSGYFA